MSIIIYTPIVTVLFRFSPSPTNN